MNIARPRHGVSGRVEFTDMHRQLSLFAQALAGTFLHLKTVEGPGPRKRVSGGGQSGCIFLPAEINDFATAEQNLGSYRISVLHQIGYLIEGTHELDPARVPIAIDTAGGDSPLEQFFLSWPRPALLRRVFLTVEDLRIDSAVRRRYPGALRDLERVLAHALASRPQAHALRTVPALIEAMLQYSLGAPAAQLIAEDSSGLLGRLIDTLALVKQQDTDVHDSALVSIRVCSEIEALLRRAPRETLMKTDAAAGGELTQESAAAAAPPWQDAALESESGLDDDEAASGVNFRGMFRADQVLKRRPGAHETTQALDQPSANFVTDDLAKAALDGPPSPPGSLLPRGRRSDDGLRSFLYDEWDYIRQSYLPAWCRIFEHRLRGDNFSFIDDVRRRHPALASQVRRQFAFIKPQSWHRVRRTSDGDELELDAVIEAVIDRRRGHVNDSHLYVRRDRARRDVAAAFLVDMSASTDFPLPDGKISAVAAEGGQQESGLYLYAGPVDLPAASVPKRRVIDVSKDALALMCDALHRLGDSYAIYGFSGDGRENVEFHVVKDFADQLSALTWAALAAMEPRRSTRMGAAIRHALSKLAREPASMKVLIIVSDGYPEDHDYGVDRTDREYGIADTARALREAEHAGVTDFCVTIDPAGHDYLRRMCRQSRYLVIDDVTSLPRELSKIYRTLTQV
jgi:nitric oxide reductase NorD protein